MSLEDKVRDAPSATSSFFVSSVVGLISGYLFHPLSVPLRVTHSLIYGAVVPLIEKIFYPNVPLSSLYKTAPADALGLFTGESLISYFRGF